MAQIGRYVDALKARAQQINEQVRDLIDHPGEKGRAAEHVVRGVVREILPKKFSIGTGFVVTPAGGKSAQLDLVLFDEQLNAPLSLVGDIGIFPIERVYASIEVKSELTKANLEDTARSIGALRALRREKQYAITAPQFDSNGNMVRIQSSSLVDTPLSPRTYIFAFKTNMSSSSLLKALAAVSEQHAAFFHGVLILEKEWFFHQLAGKEKRFKLKKTDALNAFAIKLSKDTIRYPMFPAEMTRYLEIPGDEQTADAD